MTDIKELRNEVYIEAEEKLNDTEHRCAIVRPTGFGKTGILTRFIVSGKYKNILYLYPTETVRNAVVRFYRDMTGIPVESDNEIINTRFLTTQKLIRLKETELQKLNPDLVIIDECHVIGAKQTSRALERLMELFPNCKYIGATATPDRMDMVDPISRYFNDICVSEYTLHDAFQDGILQKPYYAYCTFGDMKENNLEIGEKLKAEIALLDNEREKIRLTGDLTQRAIEISNLYNMDNVIRRVCNKYAQSTEYMKFIVFFSDFNSIHKFGKKVEDWFNGAYPKHVVTSLNVTTETKETQKNIKKLFELKPTKNQIDLIFTCDKMNLGYHVDDLTGIVMYRGTKSGTIYIQQLGRVLSSGSLNNGIVFDVVDNIHQKSVYKVLEKASVYTKNARKRIEELENKLNKWERFEKYRKNSDSDGLSPGEKAEFDAWIANGETKKREFTKCDEREYKALGRRLENPQKYYRCNSFLEPSDLIVIDEQATYEELIAKLVAEPVSRRCRIAMFRYMEEGGKCTDENGNLFTSRAQYETQLPPEAIPLAPFCYAKQLSIEKVTDWVLNSGEFPELYSKFMDVSGEINE